MQGARCHSPSFAGRLGCLSSKPSPSPSRRARGSTSPGSNPSRRSQAPWEPAQGLGGHLPRGMGLKRSPGDGYLRHREPCTEKPGNIEHDAVPPPGAGDGQRVQDGSLPVQADDDSDEGRGVHGQQPEVHEEAAGQVACPPLQRDVPDGVQRHHHHRHQQVGSSQVQQQQANVGPLAAPPAPGCPQNRQVAGGREDEEGEGDSHTGLSGGGEGGQAQGLLTALGLGTPGTAQLRGGQAAGGLRAGVPHCRVWVRMAPSCCNRQTGSGSLPRGGPGVRAPRGTGHAQHRRFRTLEPCSLPSPYPSALRSYLQLFSASPLLLQSP